jgi:hypothetical protein
MGFCEQCNESSVATYEGTGSVGLGNTYMSITWLNFYKSLF